MAEDAISPCVFAKPLRFHSVQELPPLKGELESIFHARLFEDVHQVHFDPALAVLLLAIVVGSGQADAQVDQHAGRATAPQVATLYAGRVWIDGFAHT